MKALLLAAGYATRLYPLTLNLPKPLLPIADKPVIEYIIDSVEALKKVDEIFIVTNEKFFKIFSSWKDNYKSPIKIHVVNDKTTSNENRLGAIGDIDFVIKERNIYDDLLILAGDNIFKADLGGFMNFSISKTHSISIGLYDVGDPELSKQYGIVRIDSAKKVIDFKEKPKAPKSTLASQCLYFFPKEKINLIAEYLSMGSSKDAPGYFLEWLSKKDDVFGYVFSGEMWFDIGDKESYKKADKAFRKE